MTKGFPLATSGMAFYSSFDYGLEIDTFMSVDSTSL